MLRQGLILTANREYAQAMRQGLMSLGDEKTRVDVELDALRAMQLVPQQYDLIVLDAMLNSMDGVQLLLLMKQQAPTTRFVLVSDAMDEGSRAQAYQNGADFYLKRPHNPGAWVLGLDNIRALVEPDGDSPATEQPEDGPLVQLADIVQTRCLSGDSVLLLVRSNYQSGDIFIYRGEVYHSQYPGKGGEGAFHDMMHWNGGVLHVKVLKLNHVPPRTIEVPFLKLLNRTQEGGALAPDMRPPMGELLIVSGEMVPEESVPQVVLEAPPLQEDGPQHLAEPSKLPDLTAPGETPLPAVNSHWKVNLMGELVEGSQLADPDRSAFITYFMYRKLADVAVALEVEYFSQLTLYGPHLQQVLVADNIGVRHAVFDTAWTTEAKRDQYVRWCCEQSF